MKANDKIRNYPKEGVVTILQERPDGIGYDTLLGPVKNKILDYGRSTFPFLVAGRAGADLNNTYKVANVLYGDGRPVGSLEDSVTPGFKYPANGTTSTTYPKFVNVESPNTKLTDIDALEADLFNKVNYWTVGSETSPISPSPEVDYLRFRTYLHNQLGFNTAFGDPTTASVKEISNRLMDDGNAIPTPAEIVTEQETKDLAATYYKGSFEWVVTFEAFMPQSCRAMIDGAEQTTFTFNELMLRFSPQDENSALITIDTDSQIHTGIAMRYLPNITKIDGLGILIYWSLIF